MNTKNLLAFVTLILISMPSFSHGKDDCKLVVSTISIKQATIKDSTICMVLDSALAQIKVEKVNGNNIPYAYELLIDSVGSNVKHIRLLASNDYSRFDGADSPISPKTILLEYKGRQIVINSEDYSLYKLFENNNKNINYTMYFFRINGEENTVCGLKKTITQEVLFGWDLKKKTNPFGFYHYKYDIVDFDYMYGD